MNAFRLETFSPASGPVPVKVSPAERRLAVAREEAYQAGFIAGQSEATEAFLAEEARLTSELVEAIADARMTNEAARRHVAASLAPMIEALVAGITPVLADAGLGPEIARLVDRALAHAPEATPRLRCAPELAPRIGALLAERGLEATVEEAPELLPREAQIFWDQGYDHLDLDACIAEVRGCVASHLQQGKTGEDNDDDPRKDG
jgi:flagellar biosynthesis/type III secretory pathway protein FliH